MSPLVVEKWLKMSSINPIFVIFKYTDAGAAPMIRAPFDGAFKLIWLGDSNAGIRLVIAHLVAKM